MPHKRLDSLLNSNIDRDLGDIVRRARDMGELVGCLRAALPEDEAASVVAANIRDDTLVVLVRASAWAPRLRFAGDALLAAARKSGRQAGRLEVRVAHGDSGDQSSR